MKYLPDLVALIGLILVSSGVFQMWGVGCALVALGSGLYLTAIYTVTLNAFVENQQ